MAITRIYSIAPANAYTGGPTTLHQLFYFINKTFYDVEILMPKFLIKAIRRIHQRCVVYL